MRRQVLVGLMAVAVVLAGVAAGCAAEKVKGKPAAPELTSGRLIISERDLREFKGEQKRPEGPPPKPLIIQFKHISAESFIETLHQLGRHPRIGRTLEQLPLALNRDANAVVILGPPEATGYLAGIAKGLDQPNAFAAEQEEREREQMSFRLKMGEAKRKILGPPPALQSPPGAKPPMRPPERGLGMRPPEGPPPERGPGMMGMGRGGMGMGGQRVAPLEGPPPERGPGMRMPEGPPPQRGPGMMGMGRGGMGMGRGGMGMQGPRMMENQGPMRQFRPLWRLTAPEAKEALGLSDEQVEKIKGILSEAAPRLGQMMAQGQEEMKNVPLAERPERMREMMQRRMAECAERVQQAREAVMETLKPDQRERAEKWLQEPGPRTAPAQPAAPGPKPREPGPSGDRRGRPAREAAPPAPAPMARPVAGPPMEEAPARFWLVEENVAPPPARPPERSQQQPGPPMPVLPWLEDPAVREQVGMSLDQETKLFMLMDRAKKLREESEAVATEANAVLNAEQLEKLRAVVRENQRRQRATDGLCGLTTPSARERLGLSDEQAEKIGAIVQDLEAAVGKVQREMVGAPGGPPPDEAARENRREAQRRQDELNRDAQKRQEELLRDARTKVADLLTPEQRGKAEQILAERRLVTMDRGGPRLTGTNPMRQFQVLMRLASPEAREKIGLSEEEMNTIRSVLTEAVPRVQQIMAGVQQEINGIPPEERPRRIPEIMSKPMAEAAEIVHGAREAAMKNLSPDERERAERWLRDESQRTPPDEPGGRGQRRPDPGRTPDAGRTPDPGRRLDPAADSPMDGSAVRFWLVEDVAGAPPAGGPSERPKRQPGPAIPILRLLDDPAVRAQLGLSLDQETRIFTLMEKSKNLRERIREDVEARFREGIRRAPEAERRARRQEFERVSEEAMQAARADFEAIANEAEAALTADQAAKLRAISRERARRQMAAGGMGILITPPARERLGLTDEKVEKIKNVLRDFEEPAPKGRREKLGAVAAATPPSEEAMKRHEELLKNARARIMDVLTPEQRDKAERLLEARKPLKENRPGKERGRPEVPTPTKGYGEAI
ncbi:MAG: Spy/CpxP family protein refolding chaperone [Planctomycetota bacterium]|nr:Spy/CpxP family protein refolding chaperone [Planctomycetota bacterium]